jgi:hypothetical protein
MLPAFPDDAARTVGSDALACRFAESLLLACPKQDRTADTLPFGPAARLIT